MRIFPAAISGGAFVLLVFAVGRIDQWFVRPPACLLRSLAGIPCPGCGGTRALKELSQGNLGEAFWFNPLIVVVAVLLAGWLVLVLGARLVPGGVSAAAPRWLAGVKEKAGVAMGVLVVVHWVYLILFLK